MRVDVTVAERREHTTLVRVDVTTSDGAKKQVLISVHDDLVREMLREHIRAAVLEVLEQ